LKNGSKDFKMYKNTLIKNFHSDIYKQMNRDLTNMNNLDLREHFLKYGHNEGRIFSSVVDRDSFLNSLLPYDSALEIGPFAHPVLYGDDVEYFDVLDKPGLIIRALEHHIDPVNVPDIHWVSTTADIGIVTKTYDMVLSSHCIEHQPDLILHLQNVEKLLNPGGSYVLVIPDKRYCFDYYFAASNIGKILLAHEERRTAHTLESVVEHRVLVTHNNCWEHWAGNHGTVNLNPETVYNAYHEYKDSLVTNKYIDVHAWQFTPESFFDIMECLYILQLTKFKVDCVYPTVKDNIEFYVVLSL